MLQIKYHILLLSKLLYSMALNIWTTLSTLKNYHRKKHYIIKDFGQTIASTYKLILYIQITVPIHKLNFITMYKQIYLYS